MKNIYLVLLLLCSAMAGADIVYKWTDAEGNIKFGSKPPVGVEAEEMEISADSAGIDLAGSRIAEQCKDIARDEYGHCVDSVMYQIKKEQEEDLY